MAGADLLGDKCRISATTQHERNNDFIDRT
jgi:hypothetical protein